LLHERGISIIVRGAVASGLLVGREPASYLQYTDSEVAKAAKAISAVGSELGTDSLEIALAYVFAEPAVSTVALGLRTPLQLDEALRAMERMRAIDPQHLTVLRHAVREFTYDNHR